MVELPVAGNGGITSLLGAGAIAILEQKGFFPLLRYVSSLPQVRRSELPASGLHWRGTGFGCKKLVRQFRAQSLII